MKNLHKRILGVGIACSSLVGMAFATLPKQPTGILSTLNLAKAKSELGFIETITATGPEKEIKDNSSAKSTLRGPVKTISNISIGLTISTTEQTVQLNWITPQ